MWFQLVDGHTLFDYNVGLNEIIQILVRKPVAVIDSNGVTKTEEAQLTTSENVSVRLHNWTLTHRVIASQVFLTVYTVSQKRLTV